MATTRQKREKREERVSGRQRATDHKSGFEASSVRLPEGVGFFSVKKAGVQRIEILPYRVPDGAGNPYAKDGLLHFERTFWIHRNVGANNEAKICPRKTAEKRCPVCEYRSQLTKEDDADEDLIKDLAPRERQLWNVFDHADAEAGVQVWDVSFHLFGKMLDARIKNADEDDDYEYFADPKDGMTLKIGFAEKSFAGNSFYETETIDFKPRRKALDPELFEKVVVLDDVLIVEEYEALKAMFLQTEGDDDKDDRKEDEPKKERKKKPPAKPKEEKILTAKEAGLEKGDEVECGALICEIIKISGDGTSLTLMDADDEIHKAVAVSEVTKLDDVKVTGTGTTQPQGVIDTAESEAKTSSDDGEGGSWADDEWPDGDD